MTCCERSEDPHRAWVSGCQLSRPRPLKPPRPHHQRQARQLASAFVRRQTPLICLSPARLSVDLFDAGCRALLWLVDVSAILRSASILIRSEEQTPTPSSATQSRSSGVWETPAQEDRPHTAPEHTSHRFSALPNESGQIDTARLKWLRQEPGFPHGVSLVLCRCPPAEASTQLYSARTNHHLIRW
jgi:hypothetical protein